MNGFIAKIEAFLNTGLGSVVKAVFFLILAYVVASIVKAAITKLLTREKVASFVAKADGNQPAGTTAGYISKLVYLLVFLLFIPGIFGALGADNVSAPILGMLNKVWTYIPNVLGQLNNRKIYNECNESGKFSVFCTVIISILIQIREC